MANIASDTFTGTSGTALSTYDANWVEHSSYTSGNLILSDANAVRRDNANASAYYHSATPPSADYSVSADLFAKSGNGGDSYTGVTGRMSTSDNTFYMARYSGLGTNGWQLYKFVAGTPTQLGSTVSDTLADESTTNVKLEMNGSAIKLYKAGSSTATISATDPSPITVAGKAGIRFAGVTAETNTAGLHITSWTADTLGSVTYTLYSPTMVYSAGSWYPQVGETVA